MQQTDFLIIGAGIAGLSAAHLLAGKGKVTVLTKGKLKEANTYWAQGGIAAVMSPEDNFESHIEDTLKAGANHNDPHAVRFLVENGPKAIRFLKEVGVPFLEEPVREAGHARARVWRTSDFTGQDILNQLIRAVQKNEAIGIHEGAEAVQLIVHQGRCLGAFLRNESKGTIEPFLARHTIIATGGVGQLFARTTNTFGSSGDGLALALKAGLKLKDMEFIQFHPTALAIPDEGRHFLLSEALRGFGAKIVNHKEQPFLQQFHPDAELAPRDVVARAVFFELMNGPVYLDMRHLEGKAIKTHFPNIYKRLKSSYKLDLTKDLIPITPAAHYLCGGIPTNLKGATELSGFYAIGEVACTGVQGANRLASNSLLEAVVFAQSLAESFEAAVINGQPFFPDFPLTPPEVIFEDLSQVKAYAQRIKEIMWAEAGVVRTLEGLKKAKVDIEAIPARDLRIQHRQQVCYAILSACLARPKSLGCHYIAG